MLIETNKKFKYWKENNETHSCEIGNYILEVMPFKEYTGLYYFNMYLIMNGCKNNIGRVFGESKQLFKTINAAKRKAEILYKKFRRAVKE